MNVQAMSLRGLAMALFLALGCGVGGSGSTGLAPSLEPAPLEQEELDQLRTEGGCITRGSSAYCAIAALPEMAGLPENSPEGPLRAIAMDEQAIDPDCFALGLCAGRDSPDLGSSVVLGDEAACAAASREDSATVWQRGPLVELSSLGAPGRRFGLLPLPDDASDPPREVAVLCYSERPVSPPAEFADLSEGGADLIFVPRS